MISAHSHWEKADICDMSRPQELTRTMNGATLVFLVPSVYNFLLALRIDHPVLLSVWRHHPQDWAPLGLQPGLLHLCIHRVIDTV